MANAEHLKIVALVSVGQHPKSGRARRAEQDARAVELGLNLCGEKVQVLHAGDVAEESLRSYAGMGLKQLRVLQQAAGADASVALGDYLSEHLPDIVLTGVRAESGESSGMTPYLLAEKLGWPLVTRIADIARIENGEAEILQALPRGQRRAIRVRLPFVASVDNAAAAPRQSAYGPGRRAELENLPWVETADEVRAAFEEAPARKRPKRLKMVKAKTAAERFKAATAKSQGGGGRVIKDQPPHEQAQAIFDLLLEEGVLR
ncbi:electron transfer flavoprotein subunit beta [Marinobacterium nitratireducens]|uniref:Electron transfer flavoprotein subunit beta n=1 Tax=Marinobacterium nitratireducens TaxID=518897 RepID=A0A917ZK38_9GAMM|nr:electron transfer flavoprotein subunit beta [Marinobacterium nitratireducens]GGO84680.1 electron transfer flavoprotein subunit beta [Marinobacterium nitratireducens]